MTALHAAHCPNSPKKQRLHTLNVPRSIASRSSHFLRISVKWFVGLWPRFDPSQIQNLRFIAIGARIHNQRDCLLSLESPSPSLMRLGGNRKDCKGEEIQPGQAFSVGIAPLFEQRSCVRHMSRGKHRPVQFRDFWVIRFQFSHTAAVDHAPGRHSGIEAHVTAGAPHPHE